MYAFTICAHQETKTVTTRILIKLYIFFPSTFALFCVGGSHKIPPKYFEVDFIEFLESDYTSAMKNSFYFKGFYTSAFMATKVHQERISVSRNKKMPLP